MSHGHSDHTSSPAQADPAEVERSQEMWHWFTGMFTKATVAIIIGVVLLAWITL
jgi:hypothetical protein